MSAPGGAPAIRLRAVTAGYAGTRVLERADVTVQAGEFVGVVGPSGSGKTTLLRTLIGAATVYAGDVEIFGTPVRPNRPPAKVGYVPQISAGDIAFPLTVEQVVLLGLTATSHKLPWFTRAEHANAAAILERLGIAAMAHRPIAELSGGQRQRMLLARAMVRDSRLILLDEPTTGVDLAARGEILRLLGELHRDGLTVVLTTHDLNWVATQLPRLVCVHGRVVADGPPQDVLTPDVLRATFGADTRVVHDGQQLLITDATPILPLSETSPDNETRP